ncbi:Ribosomal protein L11 methyltransferase [uncultured Gammaproteobacteria bacterium]
MGPWRVALDVPNEAAANLFADAIGDDADAVSVFEIETGPGAGGWLVETTWFRPPDRCRLLARVAVLAEAAGVAEPELCIETLPAIDWLTKTYQSFPPIRAGRFYIHGSHIQTLPPPGAVALRIDAATAFGTGEHASTHGCLVALDQLARRRRFGGRPLKRALDMGCGSGILAMAVARVWRVPVAAVDIDAESVRVARENAHFNRVARYVHAHCGDGYHTPVARRHRPYQLIMANILARPLARMAPALARNLDKGGVAVLSGLLARQQRLVISAHRRQGLRLVGRVSGPEWVTLIMAKRP